PPVSTPVFAAATPVFAPYFVHCSAVRAGELPLLDPHESETSAAVAAKREDHRRAVRSSMRTDPSTGSTKRHVHRRFELYYAKESWTGSVHISWELAHSDPYAIFTVGV